MIRNPHHVNSIGNATGDNHSDKDDRHIQGKCILLIHVFGKPEKRAVVMNTIVLTLKA